MECLPTLDRMINLIQGNQRYMKDMGMQSMLFMFKIHTISKQEHT